MTKTAFSTITLLIAILSGRIFAQPTQPSSWSVTSPFDAQIKELHLAENQKVKKGEPLALLEIRELELQRDAALAIAKSAADPASEQKAQADLKLLEHRIASAKIISPADGVILYATTASPGSRVRAGEQLALIVPQAAAGLSAIEQNFQDMLTNSTLIGRFTSGNNDANPKEEKYSITRVAKAFGDRWLITARIQFGQKDVSVPLIVPVKFAGDTPVISITDMSIPGLGTYTARVMFYRDQYAGTWSGKDHGGQMWGRIERAKAESPPPAGNPQETK